MRITPIILIAVTAAVASCSPSPGTGGTEQTVFATSPSGASITGASPTGITLNFSNLLDNTTHHPVRLRSIQLLSPAAPGIRSVRTIAYPFEKRGAGVFEAFQGNLPKECPRIFGHPVPLTSVVVAPRAYSKWDVVLSLIAAKPGHYGIFTMRVNYTTNGHRGWQKLYLDVRFQAVPPKKDPRLVQPFHCSAKPPRT
jgi:hypothetical protein